jgi:hypothetical protein
MVDGFETFVITFYAIAFVITLILIWSVIATAVATRKTATATEELVKQVAEIKAYLTAKGE